MFLKRGWGIDPCRKPCKTSPLSERWLTTAKSPTFERGEYAQTYVDGLSSKFNQIIPTGRGAENFPPPFQFRKKNFKR